MQPRTGPILALHEDPTCVAVAKAAGEVVVPAGGEDPHECLRHRLERERGEALWVVHRIDRDTSGVVLFARTADAHRQLSVAFERRVVEKTYLAFTAGRPGAERGRIDVPLHEARRGRSRPATAGEPGARAAVTDYAVRRTWTRAAETTALVELTPRTGRHHQIRVHLRSTGAPILFDPIYGQAAMRGALEGAPCRRLALHAWRLAVPSPATGERLTIQAPLAPDLAALRDWFDAGWSAR